MPSGSGVPPESRASDADRDRVLDVLRAAAGDGRLTADEFNERMEATLSSRTHGELAALTADLAGGPGRPGEAATQAEDTIRIAQHGGSIRRTGRWVVPRRLELRSSWCDVMLDFTDAVITYNTLRIDMKVRGGSLILVTGPGTVLDADILKVRYTHVTIGPSAESGAPVTLRVQLAGRMRYGLIEERPTGQGKHHPQSLPASPQHVQQDQEPECRGRGEGRDDRRAADDRQLAALTGRGRRRRGTRDRPAADWRGRGGGGRPRDRCGGRYVLRHVRCP